MILHFAEFSALFQCNSKILNSNNDNKPLHLEYISLKNF